MPSRTYPVYSAATRQALAANIASLPVGDGQGWEVTVKRRGETRSLAQNARWQALARMVSDETGDDIESEKLRFKAMFLTPTIKTISYTDPDTGEVKQVTVAVYPSTSKMSPGELAEFMQKVEAHAASELGVFL